jgi:hypothetical protein
LAEGVFGAGVVEPVKACKLAFLFTAVLAPKLFAVLPGLAPLMLLL